MGFIDDKYIDLIDKSLEDIIKNAGALDLKLFDSIKYSLFSGGKRLRPLLCLKTYQLFNKDIEAIIPFAASIELIHTYSLVHDDLPSMDNDDFRRGKPTNHKEFGEAFAILSGDALLNLAFETMLETTYNNCTSFDEYKRYTKAIFEISKYSGCSGMIGGQAIDLMNKFDKTDVNKLMLMYKAKTSRLIQAAIVSGGIIGGADADEIEALRNFGLNLGLAYQIKDDLLDYEEDKYIDKITYLSYYDKEEAKDEVGRLSAKASESIKLLKDKNFNYFIDLTKKLSVRNI